MRLVQAIAASILVALVAAAALAAATALALPGRALELPGALAGIAIGATLAASMLARLDFAPDRLRWLSVAGGFCLALLLAWYGLGRVDAGLAPGSLNPGIWALVGGPRRFSIALAIMVCALIVWRSGLRLGSQERLTPAEARGRVARAVLVLAGVALSGLLVSRSGLAWFGLAPYWLGTLVASLATLALAEVDAPAAGGAAGRLRPWSTLLLGAIALIALLSLAITGLLSGTALHAWGAALKALYVGIAHVVVVVAYLLLVPAQWLIDWLRSLMGRPAPRPPKAIEDILADLPEPRDPNTLLDQPWFQLALALGLAILAIWLVTRWLRGALERRGAVAAGPNELRESTYTAGRLAEDARLAAALLARRLAAAVGRRRGGAGGVRRIYAELLDLMDERGQGRRLDQTPREYLPVPQAELPGAAADLAELTRGYADARYGGRALPDERVAALTAAWRRIRVAARDGNTFQS